MQRDRQTLFRRKQKAKAVISKESVSWKGATTPVNSEVGANENFQKQHVRFIEKE